MTEPHDHNDLTRTVLALDGVSKSFGPVDVIKDVSVPVHPGKVTVLLGENGAGKSTLIKMMSGIHQPDSGRVLVDGEETRLPDTRAAEALGIATIHQELNLVPSMTVAENVTMGRVPRRMGLVNRAEQKRIAREAIARVGLDLDVDTKVGELGIARQQLVEIAKALSMDARVLILDEPTAALTSSEIETLFEVVDQLREKGVGMVFISHHLDEIPRIGDLVCVLRDGAFVAQVPADTPEDELVRHMVGREITEQYPRDHSDRERDAEPLLSVRGLATAGMVEDIEFDLYPGEVVGLAGLVGAGRTEVVRAIAGADRYTAGEVVAKGRKVPAFDIPAAVEAGIGHVPEDRKAQGLNLDASVLDNIGYATMRSTARHGLVDFAGQRERADDVAQKLRIRMRDIDQPVRALSGGNQQKAVFARWVVAKSTILLLDEPTRGVDVGAKVEIYELINQVTSNGGCVLMVSSELPEVLGMSDRVIVMSGGRIAGELSREEATQDSVMALAVSNVNRDEEVGVSA